MDTSGIRKGILDVFGQCSPCWLPFLDASGQSMKNVVNFAADGLETTLFMTGSMGKNHQKRFHNFTLPICQFGRSFETAHAHFDAQIFLGLFTLRDDEVPLGCTASSWIHSMNLWFPRLSHGSLWRMMRLNPPADWYLMILVCSGCVETAKRYWYCSRWDGRSYISPDSGCEIGELYSAVWETNLILL